MTKAEKMKDLAKHLADAHWEFVKECLDKFAEQGEAYNYNDMTTEIEWGFKKGFIHGFKHGIEE